MGNALLFTACLLGAAALGGFVGSCCASKRREDNGHEARIAELEDRLDALADHCMDEAKGLKARMADLENQFEESRVWMGDIDAKTEELGHLVGDLPTDGLLGRVGALEDQQKVNDEEHRVLRDALLGGEEGLDVR